MKYPISGFLYHALLLTIMLTQNTSCNRAFDVPGTYPDPDIIPNLTISELKAIHTRAGRFDLVEDDKIIAGIVVADDRSGNFYKSIVLQDTSGGIMVCMNGVGLFNDYPVGRKLYIHVKGLLLSDYRGLVQLGAGIDQSDPADLKMAGIASALFSRYIIKGSLHNVIVPVVVTATQLTTVMQNRFQNTLVQLKDVELTPADTGTSYANLAARQSKNVPLQTCSGGSVILRNSAYANFAGNSMPSGRGSIVGIYRVFGSSKQLMIRDTSDLQLKGARCNVNDTSTVVEEEPVEEPYTQGISLNGPAPLLFGFDQLSNGLPQGVSVRTGVSATDTGAIGAFTAAKANWNNSSGGFKNFASAATLNALSSATQQAAATNRAVGVRQVTATDKGVAFVFLLNNTIGKKKLTLRFQLQSLDAAINRISTWGVDYAVGETPVSFVPVTANPAVLQTGNGAFTNTTVEVSFPTAVNNRSRRVWIRIASLMATSGGGSRASTGIDGVSFNWEE